MEFQVVIPVLISFAISVVLGPVIIPFLRRLKMGQTERTEGVQSHLKKAGTPTMGGVIFLIATAITALFYVGDYPKIIPVLFLTLGFGIIGFLDDYLKVVLKRSDGLLPWQKFLLQVVLTAIFVFYIVKYTDISLTMRIPFWSGHFLNLGWLAVPVLFFAVIGTVNGVNFTDGLDGLASSVTLIVAVFFTVVSIGMKSGIEPITGAVVGGLMGFLLFNVYPASVFMGDTGSLTLGGIIAVFAIIIRKELLIPILCGIFLVENLSVLMQTFYFKYTKKKYGVEDYVFVSKKNPEKPMAYTTMTYHLQKAIRELDLRDDKGRPFTPKTHIFRHCYGVKLTELHIPDETIAELLGHKNTDSVSYYRKISNKVMAKETRKSREKMDDILRDIINQWDGYEVVE